MIIIEIKVLFVRVDKMVQQRNVFSVCTSIQDRRVLNRYIKFSNYYSTAQCTLYVSQLVYADTTFGLYRFFKLNINRTPLFSILLSVYTFRTENTFLTTGTIKIGDNRSNTKLFICRSRL